MGNSNSQYQKLSAKAVSKYLASIRSSDEGLCLINKNFAISQYSPKFSATILSPSDEQNLYGKNILEFVSEYQPHLDKDREDLLELLSSHSFRKKSGSVLVKCENVQEVFWLEVFIKRFKILGEPTFEIAVTETPSPLSESETSSEESTSESDFNTANGTTQSFSSFITSDMRYPEGTPPSEVVFKEMERIKEMIAAVSDVNTEASLVREVDELVSAIDKNLGILDTAITEKKERIKIEKKGFQTQYAHKEETIQKDLSELEEVRIGQGALMNVNKSMKNNLSKLKKLGHKEQALTFEFFELLGIGIAETQVVEREPESDSQPTRHRKDKSKRLDRRKSFFSPFKKRSSEKSLLKDYN